MGQLRPRPPLAGSLESAQQCRQIHSGRRLDPPHRRARWVGGGLSGPRQRHRHSRRDAGQGLRPVHAGGAFARPVARRVGGWPDAGPPLDRNARRPHRRGQRGPGPRQRVHRPFAGRFPGCAGRGRDRGRLRPRSRRLASPCGSSSSTTMSTRPTAWHGFCGSRAHEVRTAHDGRSAIEVAKEFRPQVVVLDLGLPKLDGYEVSRRLRSRPEHERRADRRRQRIRPGRGPPPFQPGRLRLSFHQAGGFPNLAGRAPRGGREPGPCQRTRADRILNRRRPECRLQGETNATPRPCLARRWIKNTRSPQAASVAFGGSIVCLNRVLESRDRSARLGGVRDGTSTARPAAGLSTVRDDAGALPARPRRTPGRSHVPRGAIHIPREPGRG